MKYLLLVCDFEDFTLPLDFNKTIPHTTSLQNINNGINRFIEMIDIYNYKVTFFVTKSMLIAHKKLLQTLIHAGHEIGIHAEINKNTTCSDIAQSLKSLKNMFEDLLQTPIYGLKSHKLTPIPPHIIKGVGFTYDNSIHPTYIPGRYCHLFKPRGIHTIDGIIYVPISVVPLLRFPYSWIWIRNFGLTYLKLCTTITLCTEQYVNIYVHNWDFADLQNVPNCKLPFFLTRNSGKKMIHHIDYFLSWCKMRNIQPKTIYSYLQLKNFISK